MNRSSRSVSDILSPALAAIALSVFIAACTPATDTSDGSSSSSSNSSAAMMGVSSSAMNSSSAAAMEESDSTYEDGTYSAGGVYRSPAGAEEIEVTLTLEDDVIVSAQVVSTATNPKSKVMQGQFIAGYSAVVVGKSIDELSLGVVNGSSLTPKGFMDAVTKIKVEAAAS
jgi:hypothetical protein